jgi:hypothetical protein
MRKKSFLNRLPGIVIKWVGSINSLIVHTLLFTLNFSLLFFGVDFNTVLLILTTVVSIEAIYLSIFMQISINQQSTLIEQETKMIKAHDKKVSMLDKIKWW